MRLFLILISTAFVLYVFHKFLLWIEASGWLYYRRRKPQGDVSTIALLDTEYHT